MCSCCMASMAPSSAGDLQCLQHICDISQSCLMPADPCLGHHKILLYKPCTIRRDNFITCLPYLAQVCLHECQHRTQLQSLTNFYATKHSWPAKVLLLPYRRKILGPLSEADRFPQGCRVIAFDRPPFGLTERPLQWPGGDTMSPYTSEVRLPNRNALQYVPQSRHALNVCPTLN